jgi:hypothetical protein
MRGGPFHRRGAGGHFYGEGLRGGRAVAVPGPALVRPALDGLLALLAVDARVRYVVFLELQVLVLVIALFVCLCVVRALARYKQSAMFGTK